VSPRATARSQFLAAATAARAVFAWTTARGMATPMTIASRRTMFPLVSVNGLALTRGRPSAADRRVQRHG
jgi:hypothetical protein